MIVKANSAPTDRPFSTSLRRSPKTSELIARDLVNRIMKEDLLVGTMLPTEKVMAESYKVGRTTMRESLRLLETRGVIIIRSGPHGGPVVRRPNAADLGEALSLLLQFSDASLSDVMEARQAIEPIMTRLAAKQITDEQLDALQVSVDSILANLHDHEVFQIENQRFHDVIAEASKSKVLGVFAASLKTIADGIMVGVEYTSNRRNAVALAHQRIIDALRKHDAAEAENMMVVHLGEAAGYWSRKYTELNSKPMRWFH